MFMRGPGASSRYARTADGKRGGWRELQPLDQTGVGQEPVEAARLGAAGAGIEQPLAALEDPLLLGERRIEWQARGLLHDQRQVGPLDGVERGAEVRRFEVHRVDRVV